MCSACYLILSFVMVTWRRSNNRKCSHKLKIYNNVFLCWLEPKYCFVASSFNNTWAITYKNRIINLQIKFRTLIEFSQFVSYSSKVYWTINDDLLAPYIPNPERDAVFKKVYKNFRSN